MEDNKLDNIERDLHDLVMKNSKLLLTVIKNQERIYKLERTNKIYSVFCLVTTIYMALPIILSIIVAFIE